MAIWREKDGDGIFQDVNVDERFSGESGPYAFDKGAAYGFIAYDGVTPDVYDSPVADSGATDETFDPTLQEGFRSSANILIGADATRSDNALRYANFKGMVTPVTAASIDDPTTELAGLNQAGQGNFLLVRGSSSATDEYTLYIWDPEDSGGADVPHVVAGDGGFWVAHSGKYGTGNHTLKGNLSVSGTGYYENALQVHSTSSEDEVVRFDDADPTPILLNRNSQVTGSLKVTGLTPTRLVKTDASAVLESVGLGTALQVLRTNAGASDVEWATATTGTVTSVGLSAPSVFSVSGSPVTGSGTLTLAWITNTAGQILRSTGSGFQGSTTLYPDTIGSGQVPYATAANVIGSSGNFLFNGSDLSVTGSFGCAALNASGDVALNGGSFVFNDAGADKDYRIESDNDQYNFFSDASTDRIGMGTSSPLGKLHLLVSGANNDVYIEERTDSISPPVLTLLKGRATSLPALANDFASIYSAQFYNSLSTISDGTQMRTLINSATSGSEAASTLFYTRHGGSAQVERMRITSDGAMQIPTLTTTPTVGATGTVNIYLKGGQIVYQYNDSGTTRYTYALLTGTTSPTVWTKSTTAP